MTKYWILLVPLFYFSCARGQNDPDKEEWIQLFNKKDLSGWDVKIKGFTLNENYAQTFRVEDGLLKAAYDQYNKFDGHFGHLFYKDKFSYYRLRVSYRFTGHQVPGGPGWAVRNNGLMLHSQPAASMGLNQDFPLSIEVQLLGGIGTGPRPTGNVCPPGTNIVMDGKLVTKHCISSSSKTYDDDQWVEIEVVVLGDSLITHIVEGDTVLSYSKPQTGGGKLAGYEWTDFEDGTPVKDGYITIQGESAPTDFRKIELLNLEGCTDPKAKNYKSYYMKSDNSKCKY
jgi:hypothetical protein